MSKSPFTARLRCESLEPRDVPATFRPTTVAALIADMNTANATPEADVIELAAGAAYTLTQGASTDHGYIGLPTVLPTGGALAIHGNGATLERVAVVNTPSFQLLHVAPGAALAVDRLTVRGGAEWEGGAVANYGTLTLTDVTLRNNTAGTAGGAVANYGTLTMTGGVVRDNAAPLGGGVYNAGELTMTGVTVQDNTARKGGGIYSVGALALTGGLVQNNHAVGMDGTNRYTYTTKGGTKGTVGPTNGTDGLGGGIYVGGTAALTGVVVTGNSAAGGAGGMGSGKYGKASDGHGIGGGIYVAASAPAAGIQLDAFTRQHTVGNTATTSNPDIFGV